MRLKYCVYEKYIASAGYPFATETDQPNTLFRHRIEYTDKPAIWQCYF